MRWKCEKEKNIEKETHKNVQLYVQQVSRHACQWNTLTDHEVGCTLEVKHEGHRQCDTNVAYVYEGTWTDGLRTTKRSLTIAGHGAEIRIRDLRNIKHEW